MENINVGQAIFNILTFFAISDNQIFEVETSLIDRCMADFKLDKEFDKKKEMKLIKDLHSASALKFEQRIKDIFETMESKLTISQKFNIITLICGVIVSDGVFQEAEEMTFRRFLPYWGISSQGINRLSSNIKQLISSGEYKSLLITD